MERKLAAILCADVFGYSRLMGEDEEATLRTLSSHRKIIDSLIEQHHGRFVNSAGDSVLAEFASVVNAVQCAVEVQSRLATENASAPIERRMEFRIGVNLGDVMVEGEQIYGDGVNVAARLESLAEPGGIHISDTVHAQVRDKLGLGYEDRGEQAVKNIARPVHVWRVLLDGTAVSRGTRRISRSYWRGGVLSLTGLAIIVGTIVLVQNLSLKSPHIHASIPPQEKPALPLPSIPSIAVLPFTNQSGDPQQEYFSEGFADQLINDLSRLPGLFVIARNSSFAYKSKPTKESEIGKELGVKYILEGSVRKEADQVRIGVELVDASSGGEVWTQRFDRPLKDIFAVQDEIVGKVVTTVGLLIKLDEREVPNRMGAARATDNLEAFDDFLRAVEFSWRFTKADNAKSRQWYQKAIALDPNFSAAYSGAGWTYWTDAWNSWSANPQADLKRSFDLAQKAQALDDTNSNVFALLSHLDWFWQKRFDQAVADAQRAVATNPNSAEGYLALAVADTSAVRPEGALHAADQAIRRDPAAQDFYEFIIGLAYDEMGRYQEAIPPLKRSIAAYPNLIATHLELIIAYAELGMSKDARAEGAEVLRISPQFTVRPPEKGVFMDAAWNKRVSDDLHKAGLK